SRVFGAATDGDSLNELKRHELEVLDDGQIAGLNGVLLGVAAEAGMRGSCLLGEMPHIFSQLPFPKASMAILKVFTAMTNIELDFAELAEQAQNMEEQLGELLTRVEEAYGTQVTEEKEEFAAESAEDKPVGPSVRRRIEDRAKAFELKQELDRLGVFKEYEDRFLDLFKKMT